MVKDTFVSYLVLLAYKTKLNNIGCHEDLKVLSCHMLHMDEVIMLNNTRKAFWKQKSHKFHRKGF